MVDINLNLKKTWLRLRSVDHGRLNRELINTNEFFNTYAGFIGSTEASVFQIEFPVQISFKEGLVKRFRGLEIINYKSVSSNCLNFILQGEDLIEIFELFVKDLIKYLNNIQKPEELPYRINSRINYWTKMFSRISGSILSLNAQRGLFGELNFLLELLRKSSDKDKIIESWRGPNSENQDFNNRLVGAEIKTSKSNELSVVVSNEFQLDHSIFDKLFLVRFQIEDMVNGGTTLKSIIDEVLSVLNEHSELIHQFMTKLDRLGIDGDYSRIYNENHFLIRAIDSWEVQDGFPALTKESINNESVSGVKYNLNLSACNEYRVDFDCVINEMI